MWLQLWLQSTAFTVVRSRSRSFTAQFSRHTELPRTCPNASKIDWPWGVSLSTANSAPGKGYKAFQGRGLQKGSEVEPSAGEEAGQQLGAVLHPFEPGLHERGELGDVVLGQVGQRSLQVRPPRLHRVELVGVRGQPVDRQPGSSGDQLGHRLTGVGVEVV